MRLRTMSTYQPREAFLDFSLFFFEIDFVSVVARRLSHVEYVAVGRKRGDRHTAWSAARAEDSQLISNVSSNNNKNI